MCYWPASIRYGVLCGWSEDAFLILQLFGQTTYSSCFLLYHLARNPAVQRRVYAEASALMPRPSDALDAKRLAAEASYARAVLKESLRLNPIAVGVGRNLNSDLVLGGFLVPKGVKYKRLKIWDIRLFCDYSNRRLQSRRIWWPAVWRRTSSIPSNFDRSAGFAMQPVERSPSIRTWCCRSVTACERVSPGDWPSRA